MHAPTAEVNGGAVRPAIYIRGPFTREQDFGMASDTHREARMSMQLYPHISADANVLSGQPVIEGMSVAVGLVVAQIASGKSVDDVAHEHGVTVEDVRAALEYAARRASEPIEAAHPTDEAGSAAAGAAERTLAEDEARQLGLDPAKLSPLGRRLLELRAQGITAGELPIATWEELHAEIAERRGGAYPDTAE